MFPIFCFCIASNNFLTFLKGSMNTGCTGKKTFNCAALRKQYTILRFQLCMHIIFSTYPFVAHSLQYMELEVRVEWSWMVHYKSSLEITRIRNVTYDCSMIDDKWYSNNEKLPCTFQSFLKNFQIQFQIFTNFCGPKTCFLKVMIDVLTAKFV